MIKQATLCFAAIGLLSACASSPSDNPKGAAKFAEDARLGERVDRICFNRTIDGFSRSDRDTIVVSAGPSEDYLLEVRGPCTNLRHAQSIAIDSSLSCVTRLDRILVSTSAFSPRDNLGRPQSCIISEIYEWSEGAEQDLENDSDAEQEAVAP